MNNYEVKAGLVELNAFDIVGLSITTNNSKATQDINALWERVFKEQIGQHIPHKSDDIIYAVYSDYEGDHEKPYRLTIGYRVSELQIPENMTSVRIIDQDYAIMSAAGQQPDALIETWKAIWSSDLDRTYKTDFETYGPRFFEEGLHEVLVHIGVNT